MVPRSTKSYRTYIDGQQVIVPDHDIKLGATISPRGYEVLEHTSDNLSLGIEKTVEEEVKLFINADNILLVYRCSRKMWNWIKIFATLKSMMK